jgi:hypothetical protein
MVAYPAYVSASKVERWSYGSMGTMGIDRCPSGPVTVCMGTAGCAHDMVMVSKPSMAARAAGSCWAAGRCRVGACAQPGESTGDAGARAAWRRGGVVGVWAERACGGGGGGVQKAGRDRPWTWMPARARSVSRTVTLGRREERRDRQSATGSGSTLARTRQYCRCSCATCCS